MSYQAADSKKEEFRKYLEKAGVVDALTKVLVGLYEEPEKPVNALDFIKHFLASPAGMDAETLKAENEELRRKNDELTSQVEELTEKLNALNSAETNEEES